MTFVDVLAAIQRSRYWCSISEGEIEEVLDVRDRPSLVPIVDSSSFYKNYRKKAINRYKSVVEFPLYLILQFFFMNIFFHTQRWQWHENTFNEEPQLANLYLTAQK
uniref:Uncharacterized protein n=1 Tax=Photinus pyralis TaxID=7054 RepID=A0A1Y1JX63_PHOPY